MPQLGPAFLHRPISGADLSSLEDGAKWLAAGMRAWAPRRALEAGWRPQAVLCDYEGEDAITPRGVIESSWAGETRLKEGQAPESALPVCVALAPSLIFETSIDLPDAARRTLKKTIELRMSELSPIPPEDAAFAIGDVCKIKDNRIEVSLAMTRKTTLRAIGGVLNGASISAIGAKPNAHGVFSYTFVDNRAGTKTRVRKWIVAGAALWIALLALVSAVELRTNKALAAVEPFEAELRQELKDLQKTKERFARLSEIGPLSIDLAEVHESVAAQLSALPDDAVITALDLSAQSLSVTGFSPTESATIANAIRRSADGYPGYDRFELTAPVTSMDDEGAAS